MIETQTPVEPVSGGVFPCIGKEMLREQRKSRLQRKDPFKARAVTRQNVSRLQQKDPLKARAATRQNVSRL